MTDNRKRKHPGQDGGRDSRRLRAKTNPDRPDPRPLPR